MVGSGMGDASISRLPAKRRHRARLRVSHSIGQRALVDAKFMVLQDWCLTPPKEAPNGGWGETVYRFSTSGQEEIEVVRQKMYRGQKKVVDLPLLKDHWDPAMMAWWIMDDGSQSGGCLRLHTENFTQEEVENLARWMTAHTGWDVKAARAKKNKPYFILTFSRSASVALATWVRPHIIPEMAYKITPVLEAPREYLCCLCGESIPYLPGKNVKYGLMKYCLAPVCHRVASLIGHHLYKGQSAESIYRRMTERSCAHCGQRIAPTAPLNRKFCQDPECQRLRTQTYMATYHQSRRESSLFEK